jgi:methyltransferase (TIGR00027 family)
LQADTPSRTAIAVSVLRAVAAHPLRDGVVDPLAVRALPQVPACFVRWCGPLLRLPGIELLWRYAWVGLASHVVLRTLRIDEAVSDALRGGVRQLVLLGAGFDTRALRLAAPAGAHTWEIDHPDTQAAKAARMPDSPARYVPVDFLRDDPGDQLVRAGFNAAAPAVVIWEGVTPYLPTAATEASLASMARVLAPGSVLLVTFCLPELTSLVRTQGERAHRVFRRIGEPLLGVQPEAAFHARLRAAGFEPITTDGGREWAARFGRPVPANIIEERLVVATRTAEPSGMIRL